MGASAVALWTWMTKSPSDVEPFSVDAFGIDGAYPGGTVTINSSGGGDVFAFQEAVFKYTEDGVRLRVNGRCNSSCAFGVELMHRIGGKVCVTEKAYFGYHMIRYTPGGVEKYAIPMVLRKEIRDYVRDNGGWRVHGLPTVDVGHKQLDEWYPWCN